MRCKWLGWKFWRCLGFVGMGGIWLIMQGLGILLRRRIVGSFSEGMGNLYFFRLYAI